MVPAYQYVPNMETDSYGVNENKMNVSSGLEVINSVANFFFDKQFFLTNAMKYCFALRKKDREMQLLFSEKNILFILSKFPMTVLSFIQYIIE